MFNDLNEETINRILFRTNYYLGESTKKKWNIIFDKDIEVFRDEDMNKEYTDVMPEFYYTILINKETTIEDFKKTCLNKPGSRKYFLAGGSLDSFLHIFDYYQKNYLEPALEWFNSDKYFKEKSFLLRPGDVFFHTDIPIITKTRPLGNSYNVILNLDPERHWGEIKYVDNYDMPFIEKNNKIIWRGSTNGFLQSLTRPSRISICEKYYNHENNMIDIGFSSSHIEELRKYVKNYLSLEDQLKSKFLISLEGGDVATNLKWMLYSNSVVLMPAPTMVSWAMEDTLQPWVHYVPLEKDFNDLEEKYNWCTLNLDKCEQIAKNGKEFINQFLNEETEKIITNMVLRNYVESVNIIEGKSKGGLENAIRPTRQNN